jgi:hypothetical protein
MDAQERLQAFLRRIVANMPAGEVFFVFAAAAEPKL